MVHRKKVATYVVNANVEVTTEDREGEKLLQKSLILLAEFRNIDDKGRNTTPAPRLPSVPTVSSALAPTPDTDTGTI